MGNENIRCGAANNGTAADNQPHCLTPALATIIMGCKSLQVLAEIRQLYPSVISDDEARSLHRQLTAAIDLSLSGDEAKELREVYSPPTREQLVNEETLLTMTLTAIIATGSKAPEKAGSLATVFSQAQRTVAEPVQSILKRLLNAMVFECREVDVPADSAYADPRRTLYLLGEYWSILRSAAISGSEEMIYRVPHPLTPVLVNLRKRIIGCFDRLREVSGANEARETMLSLLSALLAGDTVELQAAEDYFNQKVAETEVFLEETRQELGRRTFDLTLAERTFLHAAHMGTDWYGRSVEAQKKGIDEFLNGPEFAELKRSRQLDDWATAFGEWLERTRAGERNASALATSDPSHTEMTPQTPTLRLTVNTTSNTAVLDGVPYELTSEQARYLHHLIKAEGDWVSSKKVYLTKVDRLKKQLAEPIRKLIQSEPGKGSRIPRAALRPG